MAWNDVEHVDLQRDKLDEKMEQRGQEKGTRIRTEVHGYDSAESYLVDYRNNIGTIEITDNSGRKLYLYDIENCDKLFDEIMEILN